MSVQKKKKTGKRRNFAGFLVILILVGVMTVHPPPTFRRQKRTRHSCVSDARTQEAQIAAQVEQRKQENAALEADLGKSDDEEFVKDLARDQLGLAESGERIFYDVNH